MKQAVVLIHGIGEQVPMDTLRGFVEAVWIKDPSLRWDNVPMDAWSKPDDLVWLVVAGFLVYFAGDAARYLHIAPPNIEKRRLIREAGVQLLQTLHEAKEADGSRKYGRIVLVGHSLGTVIGYDILAHLWPRYNAGHASKANGEPRQALDALEKLAREANRGTDFAGKYQAAQPAYLEELQAQGSQWLVTDFVTLGSPLAHGELLLAREADEFKRKKDEREFPTCPPVLEDITEDGVKAKKFSFKLGQTWLPHHAAVFAPTRWTNLYFPCRSVLWGDLIGGKMAPAFGPGIRDVAVETNLRGGLFSHTLYWSFPEDIAEERVPSWIGRLRAELRICRTPLPAKPETPAGAPIV